MKARREKYQQPTLQLHKNICVDFMKAYQDQEVDRMIALCDADCTVYFQPLGVDGKGKVHELGRSIWTNLIECFPDLDNTVHSMTSTDGAIHCRVSIRGSQSKPFFGIPSQGGHFDSEHIFVFRLNDHREIEHLLVNWDHDDFVRQLSGT